MPEQKTRLALLAAGGLAIASLATGAHAQEMANQVTLLATVVIEAGNCGTQMKLASPCAAPATVGSGIALVAVPAGDGSNQNSYPLTSDANGLISANLPPGAYELRLVQAAGPLSMKAVSFTIKPHDIEQLSISLVARRG